MERLLLLERPDDDAAERAARREAAYPLALACLAVLLFGLTLAGMLAYEAYCGFAAVYGP